MMKWLLICLLTSLIIPFSAGRSPASLTLRFLPIYRRKEFSGWGIEGYKTEELEDLYWFSAEERQDETNLLYVAVTRARNTLVLNEQMLCLKAGEEQKDGGQPATDDMENDRGEAVFPC